jgi:hypothetical protein
MFKCRLITNIRFLCEFTNLREHFFPKICATFCKQQSCSESVCGCQLFCYNLEINMYGMHVCFSYFSKHIIALNITWRYIFYKCIIIPLSRTYEDTHFTLCDCNRIVAELVKKFSAFYGTQSFFTIFTRACHWSLSWGRMNSVHTLPPYFLIIHLNIILLSMSSSSKWSLPLRFSDHNFVHISHLPHVHYMPLPFHPSWSDCPGEEYKLWSSSLCSFLQPHITSSSLGTNVLLSTLFPNTLNLW